MGTPGVVCSPKIGFAPSPNTDSSSFACHQTWRTGLNQKGPKTDRHRTLFLGSKCSPGTVLQKGDITLHQSSKAAGLYIESNIILEISSHIQQWPCKWVVTAVAGVENKITPPWYRLRLWSKEGWAPCMLWKLGMVVWSYMHAHQHNLTDLTLTCNIEYLLGDSSKGTVNSALLGTVHYLHCEVFFNVYEWETYWVSPW